MKIPLNSDIETWMPAMIARHRECFGGKTTFIDVGGYHGEFSSILFETGAFENGFIFEPNPQNLEVIRKRFADKPGINVVAAACSDRPGSTRMYCSGPSYTGSILPYKQPAGEVESFEVALQPLDESIPEADIGKVGFIKIDTQGNDLSVLKGAPRVLQASRPWVLTEMIYTDLYENQCYPEQIASLLAEHGYVKAAEFNEIYSPEGWLGWSDACFMPREQTRPSKDNYQNRPTAADIVGRLKKQPLRTYRKAITGKI